MDYVAVYWCSKSRGCLLNTSKELIYTLGSPLDGSGVWDIKVLSTAGAGDVFDGPELNNTIYAMVSEFWVSVYLPNIFKSYGVASS